ncbi:MAG TPA: YciI family protein [Luteimonas sp.]|nr:YciI family protein [Luteimonas sp.]HRO27884.1 YciI family protein [Luteimonas sp.]HRP72148.1 YciI family protein [Luteimonas sp.]
MRRTLFLLFLLLAATLPAGADEPAVRADAPVHDAALAERLGADERGMRKYVLVILKTGETRVPDGPERDHMFAGHFANMKRLADAGKLAVAGPFFTDPSGWRGLYVFAVETIDEAKALAETDPVVVQGEMVAEYHEWYGSAAMMLLPEWHERLVPPSKP